MLAHGEDVEAHALRGRGWISAIAPIRAGTTRPSGPIPTRRECSIRRRSAPNPLEQLNAYFAARASSTTEVWASAIDEEVRPLGYALSYRSFVCRMRKRRSGRLGVWEVKGRDTLEICHLLGEAIRWDWSERLGSPWGATTYVLLGSWPHSDKVRGVLTDRMGPGPSDRSNRGDPVSRWDGEV